ncbi:MAG: hypothetical protein QM726_00100 [Chitinophagaceae bacterium]
MKKIVLTLTMATALLASSFTYAAEKEPGIKTKEAFNNQFTQAKNVEWVSMNNEGLYQAKFTFNNEVLQAFFNEEGDFLGTTRQLTKAQLPVLVINELDKQYADAHLVSIFEFSKKDGLEYYITITNSKGAKVLKANGSGEISVYKKNFK